MCSVMIKRYWEKWECSEYNYFKTVHHSMLESKISYRKRLRQPMFPRIFSTRTFTGKSRPRKGVYSSRHNVEPVSTVPTIAFWNPCYKHFHTKFSLISWQCFSVIVNCFNLCHSIGACATQHQTIPASWSSVFIHITITAQDLTYTLCCETTTAR